MATDLFSRYVWIVDTIKRHGSITRELLNEKWLRSKFCEDGRPLTRRTFYNYRQAIEELFQIEIRFNPATYEYSIDAIEGNTASITDWMLNAAATSNVLAGAREAASRIFVEDVPSARMHLGAVIEALKEFRPLRFTYHSYTRQNPATNILLEPYFLKIFRQRWYITGRNVREKKLKTYALDRMADVVIEPERFELPSDFDAAAYTAPSFGIIFDDGGQPREVKLRVDSRQAKYLRALPLHASQKEAIHDTYSVFTLQLRLTPDFLQELLAMGPSLTVISPSELRSAHIDSLRKTLQNYDD